MAGQDRMRNMSEYAIQVKNVSKVYKLYNRPADRLIDTFGLPGKKRFQEHVALKDISFKVRKGETLGIIGTNGSGKSTILKIITGVLNPTGGEVVIDGRISALLELGAGFNMEYTGIQNVYLNGMMMGFSDAEIDAKLQNILEFADIGEFVNQPVRTYSSGMFVRLAFAVAINIDPEILIVDEALSVGDVFFQAKCYKKFEEFKEQGKTIIFVSHDLSSIVKYCDRVVLLNRGSMLDEGTPKDMVGLYKRVMLGAARAEIKKKAFGSGEALEEALWKSHYILNKDVDEYGSGKAEIIDFAILDDQGKFTSCIEKGSGFTIKSKVLFHSEISEPIFTYSFKDVKGTTITGTNTMFENVGTGTAAPGDIFVASFEQEMFLQGGEYLLSISCTGYEAGGFTAYHRLYDICHVTVISDKDTVGYYDMNSRVKVTKE